MKSRLRKVAEKQGNDFYAYHGTDKKNVDSILKNGLRPGPSGFIYLSYNKEVAKKFAQKHENPVVIKVKMDGFNMQEAILNNHTLPFYEVTKKYFEEKMINSKEYKDISSSEDLPYEGNVSMFLEDLSVEHTELYLKWSNDLVDYYFDKLDADLMVVNVSPNQIVDIEE